MNYRRNEVVFIGGEWIGMEKIKEVVEKLRFKNRVSVVYF